MDYIIIGLLVVCIILIIVNMFKKQNDNSIEVIKNVSELKNDVTKTIGDFKYDFSKSLENDFSVLNDKMERRLSEMNDRVNQRLDESLDKTNKTFNNVLERLTKIDEAQKNIDMLSKDIVNLQSVLTDKKTRGTFGEVNLNYILTSIFGERKDIYDIQHKLENDSIADAIIYGADPIKNICIDSKFPLENYERMTNRDLSKELRTQAYKLFEADVKKHIDDISSKYIIPNVTADQAIMFVPAEAVFAEINAYHEDLLKYAYKKKVWICGPTTLMSTLSTVAMILKNIERDKYSQIIHQELNKLGVEFSRYKDRWDKLSKSIDTVSNEVKDIHTTTEKITKRFESIQDANVKELTYDEEK
ncbi:MAG: DNA recombination protein RmuC [Bacilli bacterium]|nr:DNA recombination protein RmuC [Bacilli bacterium]